MNVFTDPMSAPRRRTDALIEMPFTAESSGVVRRAAEFVSCHQLKNAALWELFADQFKKQPDAENGGWRGEYWGKAMRGGCMVYRVTNDISLYRELEKAVKLLLSASSPEGRISSYPKDNEFFGWDMWCRKYVLLGLEYFYVICDDEELKSAVLSASRAHMDRIMEKVGRGEGRKDILETSRWWGAMNSCSILEPVVRLYLLTNEKKYLDYAAYIIGTGGSNLGNIFELALKNERAPYEYPVVKAYETMSFFEGVAEYYRVTGDEKCLRAVLNFTDAVLKTDYTVIGGCGCTHELFDNSSVVQTEQRVEIMQETCVAVTLSKLLFNAFCLTGDIKYADAIETTYYNNILGSINFGKCDKLLMDPAFPGDYSYSEEFVKAIGGFTFDSYAPLYKSARNRKTGGYQPIEGGKAYGCCACIGSAGTAVLPLSAVLLRRGGRELVISQYTDGRFEYTLPSGKILTVTEKTGYPFDEKLHMEIAFSKDCGIETVMFRIPSAGNAAVETGGERAVAQAGSFYALPAPRSGGVLTVDITFDLTAKIIKLGGRSAVKKGCIVMAADCRSADIDTVIGPKIVSDLPARADFETRLCREIAFDNGASLTLVDYASAGSDWTAEKRDITAWFDTER